MAGERMTMSKRANRWTDEPCFIHGRVTVHNRGFCAECEREIDEWVASLDDKRADLELPSQGGPSGGSVT